MNTKKSKPSTAIVLVLMLTFATLMASAQFVKGADVKTYAFLSANPNPAGVNELVVVNAWVEPLQPTAFDVFHGFMITITHPDGTSETRGPLASSAVGSQFFTYIPTQVGSYTLKMEYPGETFASTGDVYAASTTPVTTLVVQQTPIQSYPETPIPTGYWTRPVNAQNRAWASITGDWLYRSYNATYNFATSDAAMGFNPYSQAARSAHVMWTKELALGGTVGGTSGDTSFYTGLTYEEKLAPPIVMDGKIYYNIMPSDFGSGAGLNGQLPGFVCVDLRTGQELFRNMNGTIDAGQEYNFQSGNQMGPIPYLWDLAIPGVFSSMMGLPPRLAYKLYDANTGTLIATFQHAMPAGSAPPIPGLILSSMIVYGSDGTIYIYFLDGLNNWLAMWNSTRAFEKAGLIPELIGSEVPFLRNRPGTYEWGLGIQWNVTIPAHQITEPGIGTVGPSFFAGAATGNVLLASVGTFAKFFNNIGYDMNTGQELWIKEAKLASIFHAAGEGILAIFDTATMTWVGYDANTGNQLWVSDPADYPWGAYTNAAVVAYDKLFTLSYDGSVHAFDIKTGKQVWKFYSGDDKYRETPYGHYPFYYGPIVADGVIYAGTGEHSPSEPLIRGERLFAIDANTGQGLWNITGLHVMQAIADGYLLTYNGYDNRIYVFGKGPSATTVSAPQTAIPQGTAFTISGTVTDQSSGQPGTPAISDVDMGPYMDNLKGQQPLTITHVTGVPVQLSAHAPDGNEIAIATLTSDAYGNFFYSWTPPSTGLYRIIATFAGSNSYGSSVAETAVTVSTGPAAIVTPSSAPSPGGIPASYLYLIAAAVAIIVVIVVLASALKRRNKPK